MSSVYTQRIMAALAATGLVAGAMLTLAPPAHASQDPCTSAAEFNATGGNIGEFSTDAGTPAPNAGCPASTPEPTPPPAVVTPEPAPEPPAPVVEPTPEPEPAVAEAVAMPVPEPTEMAVPSKPKKPKKPKATAAPEATPTQDPTPTATKKPRKPKAEKVTETPVVPVPRVKEIPEDVAPANVPADCETATFPWLWLLAAFLAGTILAAFAFRRRRNDDDKDEDETAPIDQEATV